MLESILCEVTGYDADVLEPLIGLGVQIGREGRGRSRVGTLFTLEAQTRKQRIAALDIIETLKSCAVIAGYKKAEKHDSSRIIEETRQ
jgi:hypothetical protein